MKVSIIVPIYKVEKYIEKCLESIINQTYKEFELILVNDNTPDNSLNLAKSFLESTSFLNYKIIDKNKNEGVSAARNSGMRLAKGEYVLFVDSDDYLEYDMLEHLISKIIIDTVDIVVCNTYRISDDLAVKNTYLQSPFKGLISGKDAAQSLLHFKERNYFWRCLFVRSLFEGNEFPSNVYYEDAWLLPIVWSRAQNLYFIENELYAYRDNPNSISNNDTNLELYWLVPENLNGLLLYFKSYKEGVLYNDAIWCCYTWIRNLSITIAIRTKNYLSIRQILYKYCSFLDPQIFLFNKKIIVDKKLYVQLIILKFTPKLFYKKISMGSL